MHQQNVSILGLSVTEERSVQNFHRHFSFGQLPPAADGHQHKGAEPAQHNQQHADTVSFQNKQPDEQAAKKFLTDLQQHENVQLFLYVAETSRCRKFSSDWLIFFRQPHPQTVPLTTFLWQHLNESLLVYSAS